LIESQAYRDVATLEQVVARLRSGEQSMRVVSSLEHLQSATLRADALRILNLSRRTGASAATALAQLAHAERKRVELEHQLDGEFAVPKATVRLVIALPIAVLVFAQILGLPLLEVLITERAGQISVALGVVLLLVGRRWSRRILERATPKPEAESTRLESLASALRCGLSFSLAAREVGLDAELLARLSTERKLARERGSPIADLVSLRAQTIRDAHAHEALLRVRAAGVRLMVPLGATVLPALLLLLVVPLGIGLTRPTLT
jgi:tight adherence protein B